MRIARLDRPGHGPTYVELVGPDTTDGPTGTGRILDRAPWLGGTPTGEELPVDGARLLAPVEPTKIVCIGRNYAAHAKELGNEVPKEPLLFFKPPSSLLGHGGTIELPVQSARVEHEAELGVVIGRRARDVTREDALAHVYGYTCVGDITARDLQKSDGQWTRAKGFDTFCPTGPTVISAATAGLDPARLRVTCRVNDETRQDGVTSDMIFDIPHLIAYVSAAMTLEPGDLLVTGTPEGVGPLRDGDRLEIGIRGVDAGPAVGTLVVHVGTVAAASRSAR